MKPVMQASARHDAGMVQLVFIEQFAGSPGGERRSTHTLTRAEASELLKQLTFATAQAQFAHTDSTRQEFVR